MRLAAPSFFRSDARSSTKNPPNLYKVGSEIFETVHIPGRPRILPSGKRDPIWIKFPDHDASSVFDGGGSARSTTSFPSLRIQPLIESKASPAPWVRAPVFDATSVGGVPPPTTSRPLARTMFILGFFCPLLWLVGAYLLWRHVAPPSQVERGAGTLETKESEVRYLLEAEEKWAWCCIWAFVLLMVAASGTLLALYFTHHI